jgi:hypothetical protein
MAGRQRPAAGFCRYRREDPEEVLDPAVAVAQQADRFVEAVVGALSNLYCHRWQEPPWNVPITNEQPGRPAT